MRKKIYYLILFFTIFLFSYCNRNSSLSYKLISPEIKSTETIYRSENIPSISCQARIKNKIIAISNDIVLIDLDKKQDRIIFKNGTGPDQVYKPSRLRIYNQDIYINSFYSLNRIFKISGIDEEIKLEQVNFGINIFDIDDLKFISEDTLVLANVYWPDHLIKIYDSKKHRILKKIGKSKKDKLMMKFNINQASICVVKDKLYIIESIAPEIIVFSLEKYTMVEKIVLNPPFYKPHPKKYKVNKYDDKGHKQWMSSWTSINDILTDKAWILIKYKKGYEPLYFYEFIDLKNKSNRLYIPETSSNIFEFSIEKDFIKVWATKLDGENIEWITEKYLNKSGDGG